MLEELKLGMFGTEEHLAKIRSKMATSEQMDAMGKQMMDKLDALSSGQAEVIAKLDGLAATQEKQSKRQHAKSDRNAALEDAEIAEADIVLDLGALLGAGGFGEVYGGMIYKRTPVAIKVVLTKGLTIAQRNKLVKDFVNEVAIMTKLTHPNIVRILGCCTSVTDKLYVRERSGHISCRASGQATPETPSPPASSLYSSLPPH